MKIACVINQYPPNVTSGLGRYIEAITPHLADRHELAVFTLNDGRQTASERRDGVNIYRPSGRILGAVSRRGRLNRTHRSGFALLAANVVVSNWRYFQLLRRAEADARPDLVAVHDSTNFLCGLLCHYVLRLPVVFHIHTTEYGIAAHRSIVNPFRLFVAIERWLARIAERVVVCTPEVRDQLAAAGWNRATIDVVALGGTFERVLADREFRWDRLRAGAVDLRTRLGIPAAEPVLLFVGRFERQKGIYQLLEAMPSIVASLPGIHLVMVGEGDDAGVQRIVAETGLTGHVITSGRFVVAEELMEHYEMADTCVFPSLFEPFGLVATEAMALAKPTILGAGFSQVFLGDPARPAVRFVRSTDPVDIARTVIAVMTSKELRDELGKRGEQHVRERLSWSRTAEETLAVYRKVLAGPAA